MRKIRPPNGTTSVKGLGLSTIRSRKNQVMQNELRSKLPYLIVGSLGQAPSGLYYPQILTRQLHASIHE